MTIRQPNFVIIMADFMGALTLPPYGNRIAKTPNLTRFAEESVVFENAYCNFPLCAPSRASMMSGLLPSEIGVFDNGAEFPASIPTFAHYLRQQGYRCELTGKMHFVGPDQLHGFDERLTTDVVPADFGWMPPWRDDGLTGWPSLSPIRDTGVVARTMGIDFDEEVTHRAVRRLYDLARDRDQQPFALTVSYIEPHEPYKTTQQWWDKYTDDEVGLPSKRLLSEADWDAHSKRLYNLMGMDEDALTDEQIIRARHGFYSMLSFVDHKIGEVLSALKTVGLSEDTIVIVTADHGSMLGERGLWGILNFFEWAMRVPFIVRAPGRFAPRRVNTNVSLVDLMPTLLDLATDGQPPTLATPIEGTSLVPLAAGEKSEGESAVYAELSAEGCVAPCVMVREGGFKYVHCETDAPLLFNLDDDPSEQINLANRPEHAELVADFQAKVHSKWNLQQWWDEVERSRQRRVLIHETFEKGNAPIWDYAVDNHPWRFYQRSFREPWQDTEHKAVLK
jgi:choline-sulfatase